MYQSDLQNKTSKVIIKELKEMFDRIDFHVREPEAYYDMNTDFTLGICLDIFVLDNIPNDGLRKKIFSIKQTLIRKLIWSYEITKNEETRL